MKKILLMIAALFMWSGLLVAQTVLYEDNLDSYPAGSYLGIVNPTWWTTWETLPGTNQDVYVSADYSHNSTAVSGLVDVTAGTATDGILKLGDKISGSYDLSWWMYVPTGKCAYFNCQHFESPGIEWAYEIYFRTAGTIECQQGGNTLTGSFPHDTWFFVDQQINLDADSIYLYINGVQIGAWNFSDDAQNPGGTNQLGGIDFFAGAASGTTEVPAFYIDDIYFAQMAAGNDPVIVVDPTSYSIALLSGDTGSGTLSVSNTGLSDLVYDIAVSYDLDIMKSVPVSSTTENKYSVKKSLTHASADPTPNANPYPGTDASAQLHYDGDNYTAIGWNTTPVNVTVAAKFLNSMTLGYAGMDMTAVEVYVNELNSGSNNMVVKIYDQGPNSYEPGTLLYEQAFTPMGASWETINLTTPVKITGKDIWVGYNFTQMDAGIYIPGADGGPADPNGDFVSTGVGWSHLAPTLDYNWNIRADLTGDVFPHWLTVTPLNGTIAPGGNNPILLAFNTANLNGGTYTAHATFLSNDPETGTLDVPVTLTVYGVGLPQLEKLGVMIYPNPAKDVLNVATNGTFSKVTITDFSGKTVYSGSNQAVDISKLSSGVYSVKVETNEGVTNTKFIKN
jgi:hypothetical protein